MGRHLVKLELLSEGSSREHTLPSSPATSAVSPSVTLFARIHETNLEAG